MRVSKQFDHSRIVKWLSGLIGVLLLLDVITFLLAESFWFQEVGYKQVFITRLLLQGGIGLLVFAVSLGTFWLNLAKAERQAWKNPTSDDERSSLPGNIGFLRLLPLVLLLGFILAASLVYYGQMTVSHWRPNLSLRNASLPVPLKFDYQTFWQLLQADNQSWQFLLLAGLTIALLILPRFLLRSIAVLVSLGFVLVLSEHWDKILLALHRLPFNRIDPLLQKDIGFYIFTLPVWELLEFWLLGLAGLTFLSVSLIYLLSANSLSQGHFPGFSLPQFRHLCGLGSWLMLMFSLSFWLDRYILLYSRNGVSYGASYTDIAIELPAYTALSLLALPLALWLFTHAVSRKKPTKWQSNPTPHTLHTLHPTFQIPRLLSALGLYFLTTLLLTVVLPLAMQHLLVQPNELRLEKPYIERTLALTRQGFKLDEIEIETFNPSSELTQESLQRNSLTVGNIRLWDKRPLLETNRQLQRIRLYYEFPDADIDRYSLPTQTGGTSQQQVLIAARELDYKAVPTAAQTWVNQHLIYTHGYGFTVSPVNTAGEGGLPDYLIEGIESVKVDPRVQTSIPIGKPRIYYGEITDTHVMTQTQAQELDYPSGSDNVYNTYDGWGGINIGSFGQRLLYAKHLKDWRMALTNNFTPQTKLLFRRNINDRVRTIAPFLRFDSDPYLVVANPGSKQWEHRSTPQSLIPNPDESYLYWLIDAYTISDRYPYSDPLGNDFNYIRNSVKVVVDAYHGAVTFYVADPQDPIIQAWSQIFPSMFQPLEQMPTVLRQHIRYPQDFYQVQFNQLMTYHMTDPVVFYNREDQWRAPNEIYGTEQRIVEPYYLIMKLPIGSSEEFILFRPYTPAQRNNLVAWLAARSDDNQYGKMLLYNFPKQELVFGPEQIEARINQDPVISERISLWNRQGSRAMQGNLLVIPIEQSLLYVEPLYLVAEQTQLPTLVRVIVVYGSRIALAETLDEALNAVFTAAPQPETTILRTTDEVPATP